MGRGLVLLGPREVGFEDLPSRSPDPGEVRLRSLLSGISHGTEMNLYRGTSGFGSQVFDPALRAFVPAESPPYPALLGYELISVVEEVGDGVDDLRPGDVVHTGTSHRDAAIVDVEESRRSTYPLVRLPAGAPLEPALFVSLAAVALQAIHDARVKVGDRVAVVGLGAIGLLVVQLARRAGAAAVHAVDLVADRRRLALELGADAAHDPAAAEPGTGVVVKRAVGGRGVDVAIETSGSDAGLHDAIACAGLGASVVTVGFYQGGASRLRLGEEWHHNRLTLVSSMGAWGAPHRSAPLWDRPRMLETATALLYSGALATDRMAIRTFPFERAAEAYRWLDEHPADALKVALTYE
jgi:threonine dehydrogenase-like Zn-dependent dehydrogenase